MIFFSNRVTDINGHKKVTKDSNKDGGTSAQTYGTTWAIGGGKGGIGKSFISSNLSICLARLGKPVTLIDLDLGSANLHTCLGLNSPKLGLSDFLTGRVNSIKDLQVKTGIPNLNFIGGFTDALNIANMSDEHKSKLIESFNDLDTPYLIFDLGAGTSEHTLDFFLMSDQQILTVVPEPTSIENAYRFLKSAYYRKIRSADSDEGFKQIIDEAMDQKNKHGIKTPADLMRFIVSQNPKEGAQLVELIKTFHIQVLLNQVRTRKDIEIGHSVKSVCRKYFGVEADFLGYIDYDNAVWQALRRRRPLVLEYPSSTLVGQFLKISKNLIKPNSMREVG